MQDQMDASTFTREMLDRTNYQNCKHNFVPPVGQSQMEVNLHNDIFKHIYCQKMTEWNQKTVSQKGGPKPKIGCSLSQRLDCLYTGMYFLNRLAGTGCLKCEWACTNFKNQEQSDRPYFNKNGVCICPIYQYQCSVLYHRSEE